MRLVCRQVNPRGDVPSASWNRRPKLRGGADACFKSCYAACACGTTSRREPAAALLGRCLAEQSKYKRLHLHAGKFTLAAMARSVLSLRHKTSVWAFWLPHCPTCMCAISREDSKWVRFAANDIFFTMALPDSAQLFQREASASHAARRSHKSSQVKLILSPKQRAKPAASRTRTCTNAAVCIASGECPSRF